MPQIVVLILRMKDARNPESAAHVSSSNHQVRTALPQSPFGKYFTSFELDSLGYTMRSLPTA